MTSLCFLSWFMSNTPCLDTVFLLLRMRRCHRQDGRGERKKVKLRRREGEKKDTKADKSGRED